MELFDMNRCVGYEYIAPMGLGVQICPIEGKPIHLRGKSSYLV